jgi:hypothetical protein
MFSAREMEKAEEVLPGISKLNWTSIVSNSKWSGHIEELNGFFRLESEYKCLLIFDNRDGAEVCRIIPNGKKVEIKVPKSKGKRSAALKDGAKIVLDLLARKADL